MIVKVQTSTLTDFAAVDGKLQAAEYGNRRPP